LSSAFGDKPALIVYLMAGYPDRSSSAEAVRAAVRGGANLIELGVPYSDPVADGPVIARAGHAALSQPGGFGLTDTIALAAQLAAEPSMVPVALMTYLNPLLRYGFDRAATDASAAGIGGVIVPDLPPDGPFAARWLAAARSAELETVFLVAPTSTSDRVEAIAEASSGFVYCVSSLGVTGERVGAREPLEPLVARVRLATRMPVAVGFGIGTPKRAEEVARFADGVIVGSAAVRRQDDPVELEAFVRTLADAVR
jgi:tryptophan synthase alpha chain